jgi:asparagine synthase (glutamine-hydrolysing)
MCGIAGFHGSFEPELLRLLADTLRHRGPDDEGQWLSPDARIGLAHRRLSIIDVSPLGHQPMEDAARSAVVVFNGEIYNFRELRNELEQRGFRFRGHSDTEVLLALYRAKGEAMLPMLNGIFAFAICDQVDRSLLLACDAMAVKPLYIAECANGFLFASELKALVPSGRISGTLDIPTLFRTLGFLWSPGGTTPFKGVQRLGPGEAVRVKNGRIVRRWEWAAPTWTADPLNLTTDDAVERVQEGLRTAVHRQMVSDVPVGAFLSGGVDSSAVVAMAREKAPSIDCFTIDTAGVRDAGSDDDFPYACQVARHLDVPLHSIRIDAPGMASWSLRTMAAESPRKAIWCKSAIVDARSPCSG